MILVPTAQSYWQQQLWKRKLNELISLQLATTGDLSLMLVMTVAIVIFVLMDRTLLRGH